MLLWTSPLVSILHVESAAAVAAAAFFGAGLSSLDMLRAGFRLRRVLGLHLAALIVPWFLLTVSALWQPNCDYLRGLLFFLGFPGVTVVFAVALARLVNALPLRSKRSALAGVGVLLAVGPPLFDFGLHPQFYTYNHVFGGVLGPIYDEELAVRPGLFVFRTLTLVWSVAFAAAAAWVDGDRTSARVRLPLFGAAALIAGAYAFAPELGMLTTHERIMNELGSVRTTRHFEIFYDSTRTSEEQIQRLVDEHEYRYSRLRRVLGIDVDGPIRSYVYPTADVKARLTGARYTNVAPVWLPEPQTHVLHSNFEAAFPHELVHVFSREFGLPLIHASLSVGLIEGLAVALEPPDGRPSPHEQVSAALLSGRLPDRAGGAVESLSDVVASRLSPFGFWTGRGAVSYATMGSFVRYLIDAYGAPPFMRAYSTAAFRDEYGKPASELAREWTDHLLALDSVPRSTADFAAHRFSVLSLLEKDCPHFVPAHRALWVDARRYLEAGDVRSAYDAVSRSIAIESGFVPALDLWAGLSLRQGDVEGVAERLGVREREDMTASLLVRRGDAHALMQRPDEARRDYRSARALLPSFAHEFLSLVLLREAVADHPNLIRGLLGADSANISMPPPAALDTSGAEIPPPFTREPSAAAVQSAPEPGAAPEPLVDGHGWWAMGPQLSDSELTRAGDGRATGAGPVRDGVRDASRAAAALALARGSRYEQAIDLLRRTTASNLSAVDPGLGGELAMRRLVWMAELSYGRGRPAEAAAYADSASAAYGSVGAENEAARMRDVGAKMRWLAAGDAAETTGRSER